MSTSHHKNTCTACWFSPSRHFFPRTWMNFLETSYKGITHLASNILLQLPTCREDKLAFGGGIIENCKCYCKCHIKQLPKTKPERTFHCIAISENKEDFTGERMCAYSKVIPLSEDFEKEIAKVRIQLGNTRQFFDSNKLLTFLYCCSFEVYFQIGV